MTSKKPLILALAVFNAALLGILVAIHGGQQAQAQVVRGAVGRFIAVTQSIDEDKSLLWVVDTVGRRMVVYRYDRFRERVGDVKKYDLRGIFRYRGQGEAGEPKRGTKPPT